MEYQELFNLLHEQHNITPIESEMDDIINVCREIIAKENEALKSIYQVGDTVYHYAYGCGEVYSISKFENESYPISVQFDDEIIVFTIDGKFHHQDKNLSLSFTPYDLVNGGFSQERPKPEPKVGDWGYFWDDENGECIFDCIASIYNKSEYKYLAKHSDTYKFFYTDIPEHIKKQMK